MSSEVPVPTERDNLSSMPSVSNLENKGDKP
jgi:hypothetical protein